MSGRRVTADELDHAASWLEEYADGDDDDPVREVMVAVGAHLRREAAARRERAFARAIVKDAGGDPRNAAHRAAARRISRDVLTRATT